MDDRTPFHFTLIQLFDKRHCTSATLELTLDVRVIHVLEEKEKQHQQPAARSVSVFATSRSVIVSCMSVAV